MSLAVIILFVSFPISAADAISPSSVKVVIEPTLEIDDNPGDFRNGFARVTKNGKIGYVNRDGKIVLPCEYDEVTTWSGFYSLRKNGKYGIASENFSALLPCEYDEVTAMSGYYLLRKNGKYGLADITLGKVLPCEYDEAPTVRSLSLSGRENSKSVIAVVVVKNGRQGLLGSNLESLLPHEYSHISVEEVGSVRIISAANPGVSKCGIIDINDHFIIPLEYDYISPLNGIPERIGELIRLQKKENGNDFYGLCDSRGSIILPCVYSEIGYESYGMIMVMEEGLRTGYADSSGRIVIPFFFGSGGHFNNGYAAVKKDGVCGLMDKSGNLIPIPEAVNISMDAGGFYVTETIYSPSGDPSLDIQNYYVINQDKTISAYGPIKMDYYDLPKEGDGLLPVPANGKWGFVDETGIVAIPFAYDYTWGFSEGLAVVEQNKAYSIIDTRGNTVAAINVDYPANFGVFSDGMVLVRQWHAETQSSVFGFIDRMGKLVVPIKYSYVSDYKNGHAHIGNADTDIIVNKSGAEVFINARIQRANPDRFSIVKNQKNNKVGLVSSDGVLLPNTFDTIFIRDEGIYADKAVYSHSGQLIIPAGFDSVSYSDGFFRVSIDGLTDSMHGVIDASGKVIVPCEYVSIRRVDTGYVVFKASTPNPDGRGSTLSEGGFINNSGRMVLPPKYDNISTAGDTVYGRIGTGITAEYKLVSTGTGIDILGFPVVTINPVSYASGYYMVSNENRRYGIVDSSGRIIMPMEYNSAIQRESGLISSIGSDNKSGYIDAANNLVVPREYDDASTTFSEGLAWVKKDGKWGLLAIERPSQWALLPVNRALAIGIIPVSLQSQYTKATTRAEFCALAVALYEKVTGKTITERMSFNDTTDVNIQKMGALGVVTGVGNGNFAPGNTITREQAAVMLANLMRAMENPLPETANTFDDRAGISTWARTQVGQVQAAGIMGGVGNNMFSPRTTYTREQSITTIMRLYDLMVVG